MPESRFNKIAGVVCNFIKKEILPQVFSCEFCEIFKNTYFMEHVRTTAFASPVLRHRMKVFGNNFYIVVYLIKYWLY